LESIGRCLREGREKGGFSLEDVERITKIRNKYLAALECGQFDALPGYAYQKAFIRTYASAIGLDPQPLLKRYELLHREQEESRAAAAAAAACKRRSGRVVALAKRLMATFNGTMEWLGL